MKSERQRIVARMAKCQRRMARAKAQHATESDIKKGQEAAEQYARLAQIVNK